jgi:pyruvate/2-oxoglutarate dehydrogenase complex dihydrolipoamide acyltransferase (E2) component
VTPAASAGPAAPTDRLSPEATEQMPAAAPSTPAGAPADVRKGPSTTLIAVIAVLVAAGGAGVALAVAAGGKSGHAVRHALARAATSTVISENETASNAAAAGGATTTASVGTGASTTTTSSAASRVFYAPGNNVICEVQAHAARCSVASSSQTFVLPEDGHASHIESGIALSAGSGSLAKYGTSVSVGDVTCMVPMEHEPRGVICHNSASGHGFEASQHTSRQKTY